MSVLRLALQRWASGDDDQDFTAVMRDAVAELRAVAGRTGIVRAPGEGRSYPLGRLSAVPKADGAESAGMYSISEWRLEPNTPGPGAHSHPEDDVFYVIEGTVSFFLGNSWIDAPKGAFVLAPGGVPHDFENRSSTPAGFLNISAPGNFEEHMPEISKWFRENRPV